MGSPFYHHPFDPVSDPLEQVSFESLVLTDELIDPFQILSGVH